MAFPVCSSGNKWVRYVPEVPLILESRRKREEEAGDGGERGGSTYYLRWKKHRRARLLGMC